MKKFSKYLIKIGFSLTIAFVATEVILRLVPVKDTDFNSTFRFSADSTLGYLPAPNQNDAYNTAAAWNPHVLTNSLGMRGPEWRKKGNPKIALLGDSFLLALEVPEQMHMATFLRASTQAEVWNAGVSGYGTYQSLLLWRKLIKKQKPNLVLLFTFLENDVWDNHCALGRVGGQINSPCCELKNGEITAKSYFLGDGDPKPGLKAWLMKYCRTCRLVRNLIFAGRRKPATGNVLDHEGDPYNVYRRQAGPVWDEAWGILAWTLESLKKECDSIGTQLLVVNIPGVLKMGGNRQALLPGGRTIDRLPADFDPHYPRRRLDSITSVFGIESLHLEPAFAAYQERHQLGSPGFQWCSDAHWNPLGHRLAADLVHNRLVQLRWIKGSPLPETPAPVDVLGGQLMQAIYGCETVKFD